MRKIAGYLTKNRSGKDQKIAQSTHENEYIKPRKTFWRNSKQFLTRAPHRLPPLPSHTDHGSPPHTPIIIYQTENGTPQIEVRLADETL